MARSLKKAKMKKEKEKVVNEKDEEVKDEAWEVGWKAAKEQAKIEFVKIKEEWWKWVNEQDKERWEKRVKAACEELATEKARIEVKAWSEGYAAGERAARG